MQISAGHGAHPERVQTILSLTLQAQLKRGGRNAASALRLAQSGLNAIGEANVRLLNQLVAAAKASSHPGGATLAAAAGRQASVINAVLHQQLVGLQRSNAFHQSLRAVMVAVAPRVPIKAFMVGSGSDSTSSVSRRIASISQ